MHSVYTVNRQKLGGFPLYFFFFFLQLKVYLSGHLSLTLRALALGSLLPSVCLSKIYHHHQRGCCWSNRLWESSSSPALWYIFISRWSRRLINCSAVESQTELTTSTSACSVSLVDNCDEQLCDEFYFYRYSRRQYVGERGVDGGRWARKWMGKDL